MLGVWKKSLIKVIQIKAIESLFFCSASDLVFRVVRDEFLKFWHGHILMFNTVKETVKLIITLHERFPHTYGTV